MMNQQVKEKWVAALRSGSYRQGKQALRTPDDEFCCLGVLCDLYRQEHPESFWLDGEFHVRKANTGNENFCSSLLPLSVQEWAGLDCSGSIKPSLMPDTPLRDDAEYYRTASGVPLTSLNDSGYFSFETIAEVIEKNL